jgi:hypothetical protein
MLRSRLVEFARTKLRTLAWRPVTLALGVVVLVGGLGRAAAIEPADSLRHGQFLVDRATLQIDERAASLRAAVNDRMVLYRGVRDLFDWERRYAGESIQPACPIEGPDGLLVRDGVADTIATRMDGVLRGYLDRHPEELLSAGRQAIELSTSHIPMPPGRFLGFHLVQLAHLFGAQCDTIEAAAARAGGGDLDGMADGFLRHMWDLSQLYAQAHATSTDRYLDCVSQEDWMAERLVCPICARQGMRLTDQRSAFREDTTAACRGALYRQSDDQATRVAQILCRHYGHIFNARCKDSSCQGAYEFSVPLPDYRRMQLEMVRGEIEEPKLDELIRRF